MANIAQNIYLAWLANEETAMQQNIRTYRDYYEGDFPTLATARQLEYLNIEGDKGVGINLCAPIVDTLCERLEVTGFNVSKRKEPGVTPAPAMQGDLSQDNSTPEDTAVIADILDGWWQANRMDGKQGWVHSAAAKDSVSFVIVEYDQDEGRPCIENDYAYDGNSGVKVHMKPGTYHKVAYATKRWREKDLQGDTLQRLNMYFPNRIEYWMSRSPEKRTYKEALWEPCEPDADDGQKLVNMKDEAGNAYQACVAWNTNTGDMAGEPLGVPVIPFINKDDGTGRGISELSNAIVINDGVNKTYLDLLAAADTAGFKMSWTDGILPEDVKVYPGAMIPVVPNEGQTSAQIGEIPPGDLAQLIAALNNQIAILSGITGTPQSRFTPAAVRPSEGTQKQDESALLAKVKDRQKTWGNSWEDVMTMCLKLERAFGSQAIPDTDGLTISTTWADAETRNEREHVETLGIKADKLSVPLEQLWLEAGYSAAQIKKFKAEAQKRQAAARLAEARAKAQQAQQQPPPQNGNGQSPSSPGQTGPPSGGNGQKQNEPTAQPVG